MSTWSRLREYNQRTSAYVDGLPFLRYSALVAFTLAVIVVGVGLAFGEAIHLVDLVTLIVMCPILGIGVATVSRQSSRKR